MKAIGLVLLLAGCGGKLAPEQVHFAPESRSAGYGFIGGMHVTLVDPTSDHIERRMSINASQLSGTFAVASGASVSLVEDSGAAKSTLTGVSGTVSIEPIPGSVGIGLGTEHVHVDVTFLDEAGGAREVHIVGDYDAELAYEG